MKFSELNLEESVLQALEAMRFEECTPVQEHTIPIILEGKDLIGVAQTGTGKTAAYLLPILNQLSKGGYPEDAINCIIMAPTRELAQQNRPTNGRFFLFYAGIQRSCIRRKRWNTL